MFHIYGNQNVIRLGERNVFVNADLYIEDKDSNIVFGNRNRVLVVKFWTRRKSPYLSRKKREQCTAAKTWRGSMSSTRASGCRVG